MACYHPMFAIVSGEEYDDLKKKYKKIVHVIGYDEHKKKIKLDEIKNKKNNYYKKNKCNKSALSQSCPAVTYYDEPECITIPCGKCIGCRLEYSRQWANRCMLELMYHDSSYFLTLTYDDAFLPKNIMPANEFDVSGEVLEVPTLCKRDWQLFAKRLRKNTGQKIRYYMCGEYGDKTFRPHYHVIMYGLMLNDLVYWSQRRGIKYYRSPMLEQIWGKGMVIVGDVTWESCAYVARYVLKKASRFNDPVARELHVLPEFVLMSRRPGIGYQYFADNYDKIYNYEYINIKTDKGGKKFRPPKYYDTQVVRLGLEEELDFDGIRERRKERIDDIIQAKLAKTDLAYSDLLKVEEENLRARLSALAEGRKEL